MSTNAEPQYVIPARYRKMENMHIIFWLVKDISWCMIWKVLGVLMIAPTMLIAILIAWRTRTVRSELAHNLAILFWIAANSYWMISEFFGFDEMPLPGGLEGKHLALIPFSIGAGILLWYYLLGKPRARSEGEVATM